MGGHPENDYHALFELLAAAHFMGIELMEKLCLIKINKNFKKAKLTGKQIKNILDKNERRKLKRKIEAANIGEENERKKRKGKAAAL